jgi:hypothetical protein
MAQFFNQHLCLPQVFRLKSFGKLICTHLTTDYDLFLPHGDNGIEIEDQCFRTCFDLSEAYPRLVCDLSATCPKLARSAFSFFIRCSYNHTGIKMSDANVAPTPIAENPQKKECVRSYE